MNVKRQSTASTYDGRETGPRFHVTTWVNDRVVGEMHKPIPDPFVYTTVEVDWRDLLRGLLRRRLRVCVNVGGAPEVIEDVMELDDNYLGPNCTRRDEFGVVLGAALSTFAAATDDNL